MADPEREALQMVWKRAAKAERELRLDCGTEADAQKIRFALYSAVKHVRKRPELDPELAAAVNECSTSFDKDNRGILVIQKKSASRLVEIVTKALGIAPDELARQEDERLRESSERLLRELQGVQAQPPVHAPVGYPVRHRKPEGDGNAS